MTSRSKPLGIVLVRQPVHLKISPVEVESSLPAELHGVPQVPVDLDAVSFSLEEGVHMDWIECARRMSAELQRLEDTIDGNPGYVVVYFGAAPVPLALLAGFRVGTWAETRVFQRRHDRKSWRWPDEGTDAPTVRVLAPSGMPDHVIRAAGDVVLCVQTSYAVVPDDIRAVIPDAIAEVTLSTSPIGLDVLAREGDVELVARAFTSVLDQIRERCPNVRTVHLFAVAPVGMTFRLGTCISATSHPRVAIYYYSHHARPRYRQAFVLQDILKSTATLPTIESVRPRDGTHGTAVSVPQAERAARLASRPLVMISYSHDSPEHSRRVLELSERLRQGGVETIIDQYETGGSPSQGWSRWMMDSLDEATVVVCVCTETYYRHFRGHGGSHRGKGVDWEGLLITQELYDARSKTTRFIPAAFSAADYDYIPEPLRPHTFYVLDSDEGFAALYDAILGQAGIEAGPLGTLQRRPPTIAAPLAFHGTTHADITALGASGPPAGSSRLAPIGSSPREQAPPIAPSPRVSMWKRKLEFLRGEEPTTTDPDAKFRLRMLIEEAEQKLREEDGG